MRVLVLGGTGFTGSYVVSLLAERGAKVRSFVRPTSDIQRLPLGRVELAYGTLEDSGSLGRALEGVDCLACVASLGFGHGPGIVEAIQASGVKRAVFVSTTAIYTSLNAPSKKVRLEAEAAIQQSGLCYTIIRPTMIYGTRRDRNLCRLIRFLQHWRVIPIFGTGQFLQQPVFVRDLAEAIVNALSNSQSQGKCYNISGADALTYNQIIDTICQVLGRSVIKIHLPAGPIIGLLRSFEKFKLPLPVRSEQVLRLNEDKAFDHDDAWRELGFRPRRFREGIQEEIAELSAP